MADLPSILGGMAQGFIDFGKGAVDLFGTGGAAIGDLVDTIKTGKVSTKNQDDFRKWLYNTDSVEDAAAKGLGTALNGVQTVTDYIPGIGAVTKNPLFNAGQGALGGLADEFKMYGKDYDLARAGERAAVGAGGAMAASGLGDALKKSASPILSSGTVQGLARGATGGAIGAGGYTAIEGGDLNDIMNSAAQGAGMGAAIGGATGALQDFKPARTYDLALTDDERQARIANAQKQIDDIGPVSLFSNNPDDIAKRARISELQGNIRAYQNGYDTAQDYADAMAAKSANRANTQSATAAQGRVYAPNMGEIEYGAPVQDGYTRLYRGMTQEFDPQYNPNAMDNMNGYESWTDNYDLANRYGDGKYVYSIDVPTSRIANSLYDENPNSATYGDRNFISAIEKAAGLDGVDGNEYLLNTNDELRSGLTYNRINAPRVLETTLSDADMAVNNPRYITDESGNPKTLYHGSPNKNITSFDINQAGKNTSSGERALYFTDSPEVADEFSYERLPSDSMFVDNRGTKGRVYPVNLEMNNPLDLDNLTDAQIKELWEYASPLGQLDGQEKFIKNLTEFRDAAHNGQLTKTLLDLDKLKDSQYDGFMARMYPNQDNQAREYAVFDNSKVKMLEDVLANDDMVVNSAKVAPGQLGLFDDMPTQTPKTGTRQTSLFDQPDNPYLDYYGADIDATPLTPEAPANPYAPVNGEVTQAMRDRAADILGNWKKNGVPENELYNAINPDTLPLGYKEAINVLDNMDAKKYLKDNLGVTDIKKAKFDKVLDYLFGDNEDAKRARIEMRDQQIESAKQKAKLLGLPGPSKNFVPTVEAQLREEVEYKMAKDISKSLKDIPVDAQTGEVMPLTSMNLERLDPKKHSFRTGYTAAADEAFSERLGIAPGNTPKYNGKMDVRGAYGRYQHPFYGAGGDVAVFERKMSSPEDAISSIAHERLHSFQNEANNEFNRAGRYSKEVQDAYNDLHKDLESFKKTPQETAKRYGRSQYWQKDKEQEARMLEVYLENRGYANAPNMQNRYRKGEWGDEINPAFDKFFDKLRDLSKRGVALPALTALFGGGAYMASQNNDKEKEVK